MPLPIPSPKQPSSRRADILLGIGMGLLWWLMGWLVAMAAFQLHVGAVLSLGPLVFLAHIIYLARRPGPNTFLVAMVITTVGVPVLGMLALIGMCSGMLK